MTQTTIYTASKEKGGSGGGSGAADMSKYLKREEFNSFFEMVIEDGVECIKAKKGLFSEEFLSCYGLNNSSRSESPYTTGVSFDVSAGSSATVLSDIVLGNNTEVIVELTGGTGAAGFDSAAYIKDVTTGMNTLTLADKSLAVGKHDLMIFATTKMTGKIYIR